MSANESASLTQESTEEDQFIDILTWIDKQELPSDKKEKNT